MERGQLCFLFALALFSSLSASSADDMFYVCHEYPCYPKHSGSSLNGFWDFSFSSNISDPTNLDLSKVVYNDRMAVPASFDASPAYAGVRGTGIYRTRTTVTPNSHWRLLFEACSLWCAVYCDGEKITEHSNGYSAFWVDMPVSSKAVREIVVVSDNRFDSKRTILQSPGYDFYQFGGLIRRVHSHVFLSMMSIENVDVLINNASAGIITARLRLHSNPTITSKLYLSYAFDGGNMSTREVHVDNNVAEIPLQVPYPRLWQPGKPELHYLQLAVQTIEDLIVVRFGLREVKACKRSSGENAVCINGEPTKLLGFSRHDAHPQFGATLDRQQWMQDLQILRDLGGNYLRLVHYPHDKRFLDLCDELGVMVWQENLGWGNSESQLTDKVFIAALLQGLEEMVSHTFNHPSVIFWAFLNEGASDMMDVCFQAYLPQANRYRELGVNGLVTWASSKKESDVCLDIADVVSFNSYPGWYGDSGDYSLQDQLATVAPEILKESDWVVTHQNKPFIKSEIGAGAIPEWHDTFNGFWTADYQSELLAIVTSIVKTNNTFSGVSLWQYYDVRTYNGPHCLGRPRGFNNKGLLDEYRRPKRPSYDAVRAVFKGL